MDPLLEAFQSKLTQPQSDSQWQQYAGTLPEDAFSRLKVLIEHPADPVSGLRTSAAFRVLCQSNDLFRTQAASYALSLPPGIVSRISREVLTWLVAASEVHTDQPHAATIKAFAYHRGYWQTSAVPNTPDVGDRVRDWLNRYLQMLFAGPTTDLIANSGYVLATARIPSPEAMQVWPYTARAQFEVADASLMNELLAHLLQDRTLDGQTDESYLLDLQKILLDAYDEAGKLPRFAPVRSDIAEGLLRHFTHICANWSDTFDSWHWIESKRPGFSISAAFKAEGMVRLCLSLLAGGVDAGGPRLLDAGAADRYGRLIGLMGGFDWSTTPPPDNHTPPAPSWERDYERAFLGSLPALPAEPGLPPEDSRLNLLEAAPIHALIRLTQKLCVLQRGATSTVTLRDETDLYLFDTILDMASEVVAVSGGQGLLPKLPLGAPVAPSQSPTSPATTLFGSMSTPRTAVGAPMHPEFRRALSIVLAAFYAWKADVAFRQLGGRSLVEPFGAATTDPVAALYQATQSLLENVDANSQGLGLAGRMLDLLREEMLDECNLRLRMLGAGQDYGGHLILAVTLEPNDLVRAVQGILNTLGGLSTLQDLDAQRKSLDDKVSIALAAEERDRDLLDAANDFLEADKFTRMAIEHEAKQQAVRVALADLRRQETNWQVAAQKYAVAAAKGNADAQAKFKEAKDVELARVQQQVKKLEDALQTLIPDLENLRDKELPAAQEAFNQFKQAARTSFNRKQAQRSFFTIVKRIGSLVSMYFTGVDLVSIAETAYSAYRSAESGDWLSAIETAGKAADSLTKGKSSAVFKGIEDTVKSYAGSLIPDSLKDAAATISSELGIDSNSALQQAVIVVGRQTFRLGVSFLAEETHTSALAQKLGLPTESEALQELREDAINALYEAANSAIAKQGPAVLTKAKQILGATGDDLREALKGLVPAGPGFSLQFDQKLVDLIRRIQADVPAADIAFLKAEMLAARDDLLARAKNWAGEKADELQSALDGLIEDAINVVQSLPPAPLPEAVATALRDFHAHVDKGRAELSFLIAPGKAQELANQISDADDEDQFDKTFKSVTDDLQGRLDSAKAQVAQAATDLAQLRDQLNGLKWDDAIAELNDKAQTYLSQAAQFTAQQQDALASAASESLLASEQAVKIEQIGSEITQDRLNAQTSVVQGRQSQVDAASASVTISELQVQRARSSRDRFELNNTAQGLKEKSAIARGISYYRDKAKAMLIQAYQLVNLYEFDLSQIAALNGFRPTFTPAKEDVIKADLDALDQARSDWKYQRIEDLRVMFSIDPTKIMAAVVDPQLKEILTRYFTGIAVTVNSSLVLNGDDLGSLSRGLTFRLLPKNLPSNMTAGRDVQGPPIETSIDPSGGLGSRATSFVPGRIRGWNDHLTYRARVLGVILEVLSGVDDGDTPQFFLSQDSGFIVVPGSGDDRKAVEIPLERTQANSGAGILLTGGPLVTRGVNVWPLFGTYTLSSPDTRDINIANFQARLHFVAVGSPS